MLGAILQLLRFLGVPEAEVHVIEKAPTAFFGSLLVLLAIIGPMIWGVTYWHYSERIAVLEARLSGQAKPPSKLGMERPVLDPIQEKLLRILVGYENQFGSLKVIVGYDGNVVPPSWDVEPTPTGINLAQDLYGDPSRGEDVRSLIERMPTQYVRLIPEVRFAGSGNSDRKNSGNSVRSSKGDRR